MPEYQNILYLFLVVLKYHKIQPPPQWISQLKCRAWYNSVMQCCLV